MKRAWLILFVCSSMQVGASDSLSWIRRENSFFNLHYTASDSSLVKSIEFKMQEGEKTISHYFGRTFSKKFDVYIFPNRDELNAQWSKDWAGPGFKSQCWMVASGVANRLDILSPLSWKKEACDHNPDDQAEMQKIITHELVHVFHAQQNPKPGFDGMDDLSWLIEGLATFVSGQLTDERMSKLKSQLKAQTPPTALAQLWTGADKYARAGSFVQFLDQKYGKKKIFQLLSYTDLPSILKYLNTDEATLIKEWKNKLVG